MKRAAKVSIGRAFSALIGCTVGGMQVGLYLADWYDDGTAEPLSLLIGVVIVAVALLLGVLPFFRER